MSKVLIVMPTYNHGRFIEQTLESIKSQTFKDWELRIINDCSTDNTEEIVKKFCINEPRAKYSNTEKNSGTGIALNKGFKNSESEYETWFASDNIMYPDMLQKLYETLEEYPEVDYVYGAFDWKQVNEEGKEIHKKPNSLKWIDMEYNGTKKTLYNYYFGIAWLWRRELRQKCGEWQKERSEDYDMVLRMEEQLAGFKFIPNTLACYVQHPANLTNDNKNYKVPERFCYFVQNKARKRRGLKYCENLYDKPTN